jgi:hypothetical protein
VGQGHIIRADGNILRRLFYMKIVLLRSPGFLSPILRKIFGIKKEKKRR